MSDYVRAWRRTPLLALVLILAFVAALTACDVDGNDDPTDVEDLPEDAEVDEEAEGEALLIGVLAPTTGPQTVIGEDLVDGVRYYVEQHPDAGDRPIALIVEDTASDPGQGLERARKLVESDEVDLIVGIINSAVLEAVASYITENDVPLIVTNAGTDSFTEEPVDPLAFRVSHTNAQNNRPLGWYAYEELGYRDVSVIRYDFIAGVEHAQGFIDVFTELGGNITNEQEVSLGTADLAPYISGVSGDADAAYVFLAGSEAVRFHQQADDFGLDVPVIGPGFTLEEIVLQAAGDAAVGFIGALQYIHTIDTPENSEFVEGYTEFAERPPTTYANDAYVAMMAVTAALEDTGGDATADTFAEALAGVEFSSPRGPFRFDENHQAVYTVYIYEVVDGEDGPTLEVIDQIEDVTHDWEPTG
jgi:branched-chain amino acid transport system substrate-binding protein